MELTDVQWELLKPLVEPRTPRKRRGRPWRDTRPVVEGVLWILRTGAQGAELPKDKFPPYQTCHRRFQRWVREGTLVQVLRALAEDLLARGPLDLSEAFIDASFSSAKKGAVQLVQHAAAKGPRKDSDAVFSAAAVAHGKLRYLQGYTPAMLVHESRILQVTLFGTLQNNLSFLDFSLLLPDVMTIADEVDAQLTSMESYMKAMQKGAAA